MSWFDLLKNIQIAGQRTSSKDYVLPDDEEDEDCFKYFYDLVKLMHPDYELNRQIHPDQPEDYWCRIKDTGWVYDRYYDYEVYEFGKGVIDSDWAEIQISFGFIEDFEVNPPRKIIDITFKMPETYETDDIRVFLQVTNNNLFASDNKTMYKIRYIDNVEEAWDKIKQHIMRA